MQREEIRAAGRLAGGAVGGFAGLIGDFHKAVAQRTFDRVGLLGAPVRLIHDGVSGAAYRSVSRALQSTAGAGAGVVAGAVGERGSRCPRWGGGVGRGGPPATTGTPTAPAGPTPCGTCSASARPTS